MRFVVKLKRKDKEQKMCKGRGEINSIRINPNLQLYRQDLSHYSLIYEKLQ